MEQCSHGLKNSELVADILVAGYNILNRVFGIDFGISDGVFVFVSGRNGGHGSRLVLGCECILYLE